MRNIWKGLFVGALTGAAVGLAVDLLYGAGDHVAAVTREAGRRAPDAADWAAAATVKAGRRLRDADLPDHVRSLAHEIADSDLGKQGRRAVRDTLSTVRDATR